MKNLKDLTPKQLMALVIYVESLVEESKSVEAYFHLVQEIKLRHELQEFRDLFEAIKKFGQEVLDMAEYKTENHFKTGEEANNE